MLGARGRAKCRDLGQTFLGFGPVHSVCLIFYDSFGTVLRFFVLGKFGIRYYSVRSNVRTNVLRTSLTYILRTHVPVQARYRIRWGGWRAALAWIMEDAIDEKNWLQYHSTSDSNPHWPHTQCPPTLTKWVWVVSGDWSQSTRILESVVSTTRLLALSRDKHQALLAFSMP